MTAPDQKCGWCEDLVPEGRLFCDEDCQRLFDREKKVEERPKEDKHDLKWRHTLSLLDRDEQRAKRDKESERSD